MSNILPPPSTAVPAVKNKKGEVSDFTQVWRQWFIDLAGIVNKSGGTGGAIGASRQINTTAPLTGGGDLSADRTISFSPEAANKVLAGPTTGIAAAPNFRSLVTADFPGISVIITTAKLTGGGANGSMTFTNGILTAQTPAT